MKTVRTMVIAFVALFAFMLFCVGITVWSSWHILPCDINVVSGTFILALIDTIVVSVLTMVGLVTWWIIQNHKVTVWCKCIDNKINRR